MDLAAANALLLPMSAEQRLRWAVNQYGPRAVLLSSMQKSASVLMHLFHTLGLSNEILFVDTQYHFIETLRLRDQFMLRYKLNIVTLYPELTPEQQEVQFSCKLYQSVDGQPTCCRLRKEDPFIQHMRKQQHALVCVGLRRGEGGARRHLEPLSPDHRFGGHVLHPIVDWSDEAIEAYLKKHDVPVHPLHAKDYPSIGCECCTTPVAPGEDARAGRWRHLRKDDDPKYCGINLTDGAGI